MASLNLNRHVIVIAPDEKMFQKIMSIVQNNESCGETKLVSIIKLDDRKKEVILL